MKPGEDAKALETFLSAAETEVRCVNPADLKAALDGVLQAAFTVFPHFSIDTMTYLRHLAERLPKGVDALTALRMLCTEDLFLACACAQGVAAAQLHLREQLHHVRADVRRINSSPAFVDEVVQAVAVRLLVSEHRPAKILEYNGRGPLRAWLKTVALGTALNLRRQNNLELGSDSDGESLKDLPVPTDDPEVQHLKAATGEAFRTAFKTALSQLTTKERNILRLRFLDGLTVAEVASYCHVHRATAVRWLSSLRMQLLTETRRLLAEHLSLSPERLDSLLQLGRQDLNFNLSSLLRQASQEGP